MIKRFKILLFLFTILLIFEGCEKSFTPKVKEISNNILVVDRLINSGSDSTIVKLSRTTLISEKQTSKPEIGAVVTFESESNESFYKWNGSAVVERVLSDEGFFKCWGNSASSNILLGSTAKLDKRIYIGRSFILSGFLTPRPDCSEPIIIKPEDLRAYYETGLSIPVGEFTGSSKLCRLYNKRNKQETSILAIKI